MLGYGMNKFGLYGAALKPERIIVAHVAFFVAIVAYWPGSNGVLGTLYGVALFVLFYGAVYLMNDILDYREDKKDPHNRKRVLASGLVTRREAVLVAALLLLLTAGGMFFYDISLFGLAILLWGMNVLYARWLKAIPYLDLFFIAWTQAIKFLVGVVVVGVSIVILFDVWPLFLAVYCAGLLMHVEKQMGRLQEGRERKFRFGHYTMRGLNRIRWFAILGGFGLTFSMWGHQFFFLMLLAMSIVTTLRFLFPGEKTMSAVHALEKIFQPR